MKTRIKFYAGNYYPQIKKFIFWLNLHVGDNYVVFKTVEEAKEYLAKGDYLYHNKVVWKS